MSICFIICSEVPIICSAFSIRCSTLLIICAIYDVICSASAVICGTFVIICCGFDTICGAYAIICCDFSIIPIFCCFISSVLSLYGVVFALYGVQMILPYVHFALFAVLSSLYRNAVMIFPQCNACVSDPSSSHPNAAILVCFRGKVESKMESKMELMACNFIQHKLGHLTEVFQREKITPDIISHLSVHEMNQLGVNNRPQVDLGLRGENRVQIFH